MTVWGSTSRLFVFISLAIITKTTLSCGENTIKASIDNCFNKLNISKQLLLEVDSVIVIPRAGCTGCIQEVTNSIISDSSILNNSLVIFTSIQDLKLLRLQIGKDILRNPHVFIDTANYFLQTELKSIYPQVIHLSKGKVIDLKRI